MLNLTRQGVIVVIFVAVGFLLNDLFHLYRFHRVEWTHVTGLFGNSQSLTLSLWLSAWVVLPIALSKYILKLIKLWGPAIVLLAMVFAVASQICGRSVLKLIFDMLLLCILFVWYNIDMSYGRFVEKQPSERSLPYIRSELITIFQTSLAVLTFVITVFGFSFAPDYIEKYYHQSIGQPTVWWFAVLTTYIAIGVLVFVCAYSWLLAVKLRSDL